MLSFRVKLFTFILLTAILGFVFSKTKTGKSFFDYLNESKKEIKKIAWPSHQETLSSVWMVSAFVVFAATFWWLIDGAITKVIALVLRIVS
jgi:preprotein translocase subunit SecE